jgi:hypothetical protein
MNDIAASDFSYVDVPSVLVIADDADAAGLAERAIALAGARIADCVGFAGAADRLGQQAALGGVLVEMTGAEPAMAETVLARVDALARAGELGVVVALDDAQIDLVTAQLLGGGANLLCTPDVGERVAALASIPHGSWRLNDATRDESDRLRLLNAEVARIAETLTRLTRGEAGEDHGGALRTLREAPRAFANYPLIETAGSIDAATVRGVIRARRMRASFFAGELFADPAWDMLLDLFAAELEHARVSVSSLCIAAAVPGTTALRWIGTMIDAGLFQRQADPFDRRRAYLSLSERARDGMVRYFDAIRRAGLASG